MEADVVVVGARLAGLTDEARLDPSAVRRTVEARDRMITNSVSKEIQIALLRGTRKYVGDRLFRTAKPHRLLDPKHGPLIAVKLHILTRKTLGGLSARRLILVDITGLSPVRKRGDADVRRPARSFPRGSRLGAAERVYFVSTRCPESAERIR